MEALINIMPVAEIENKPLEASEKKSSNNSSVPSSDRGLKDELREVKIRLKDAEELN